MKILKQSILTILKLKILKRKILNGFDDMIADISSKKTLNPVVTELLIRGRHLKTYLLFIVKFCYTIPKILG